MQPHPKGLDLIHAHFASDLQRLYGIIRARDYRGECLNFGRQRNERTICASRRAISFRMTALHRNNIS
jgi:hypothetical protein